MDVGGCICSFGLDADKARSHVTAIEDPVHRVAGKDVGDLFFGRQHNERRLQQSRADFGRFIRLRHDNRARSAGLEGMRIGRGMSCWHSQREAKKDSKGYR